MRKTSALFNSVALVFIVYLFTITSKVLAYDRFYPLTSADGQVKVFIDSKYGGAITQLYDYTNLGNVNLVNDSQAGAMFQTAFWTFPRHNYQPPVNSSGNSLLPPNCPNDSNWAIYQADNPNQAGGVANGWSGNPIGYFGANNASKEEYNISGLTPDPNEFIQFEDNGNTVHLKSRFLRYDYCISGDSHMDTRQWWDTDFYIEQWAYFHPSFQRTLTIKSKITNEGDVAQNMWSRQLPIIFARNLPRFAYWKNGQKSLTQLSGSVDVDPDANWAALIANNQESGIGIVTEPGMIPFPGWFKFNASGQLDGQQNESAIQYAGGTADLRTFGKMNNVSFYTAEPGAVAFTFAPGGSFEWTTYFPIGPINLIKNIADGLLSGKNFNLNINGYVDAVSCTSVGGWVKDDRNLNDKLTIRAEAYPQGEENNKYVMTARADGQRPDLTGVCPPNGACAYGVSWDNFPASFANKKIVTSVYGVASDGQENKIYQDLPNPIGPCSNVQTLPTPTPIPPTSTPIPPTTTPIPPTSTPIPSSTPVPPSPTSTSIPPSPTPTPIPGDITGKDGVPDGKVDIYDYNKLIGDFGKSGSPADINGNGIVDIYDYNTLVGNFGSPR